MTRQTQKTVLCVPKSRMPYNVESLENIVLCEVRVTPSNRQSDNKQTHPSTPRIMSQKQLHFFSQVTNYATNLLVLIIFKKVAATR